MTLAELSAAWNKLRDKALGRAASPTSGISADLADRIGKEFEQWRVWYLSAGSLEDTVASIAAHEWVSRYNVLAAELKAEGIAIAPVTTPVESAKRGAKRAGAAAAELGGELGTGALVLLALWLLMNRRAR